MLLGKFFSEIFCLYREKIFLNFKKLKSFVEFWKIFSNDTMHADCKNFLWPESFRYILVSQLNTEEEFFLQFIDPGASVTF